MESLPPHSGLIWDSLGKVAKQSLELQKKKGKKNQGMLLWVLLPPHLTELNKEFWRWKSGRTIPE